MYTSKILIIDVFRSFEFWRSVIGECVGTYFLLFISSCSGTSEETTRLEQVWCIVKRLGLFWIVYFSFWCVYGSFSVDLLVFCLFLVRLWFSHGSFLVHFGSFLVRFGSFLVCFGWFWLLYGSFLFCFWFVFGSFLVRFWFFLGLLLHYSFSQCRL